MERGFSDAGAEMKCTIDLLHLDFRYGVSFVAFAVVHSSSISQFPFLMSVGYFNQWLEI